MPPTPRSHWSASSFACREPASCIEMGKEGRARGMHVLPTLPPFCIWMHHPDARCVAAAAAAPSTLGRGVPSLLCRNVQSFGADSYRCRPRRLLANLATLVPRLCNVPVLSGVAKSTFLAAWMVVALVSFTERKIRCVCVCACVDLTRLCSCLCTFAHHAGQPRNATFSQLAVLTARFIANGISLLANALLSRLIPTLLQVTPPTRKMLQTIAKAAIT